MRSSRIFRYLGSFTPTRKLNSHDHKFFTATIADQIKQRYKQFGISGQLTLEEVHIALIKAMNKGSINEDLIILSPCHNTIEECAQVVKGNVSNTVKLKQSILRFMYGDLLKIESEFPDEAAMARELLIKIMSNLNDPQALHFDKDTDLLIDSFSWAKTHHPLTKGTVFSFVNKAKNIKMNCDF